MIGRMFPLSQEKTLDNNIKLIIDNINKAAKKSNRFLEDIHIVTVTKTIALDKMDYFYNKGFRNFGENRVQELLEKYDHFNDQINWHLIGHLQRNKVKYIIDKVKMIHSVDSLRLAKEINRQSKNINRITPILVQVNVAQETSKFGIKIEEVDNYIQELSNYNNIIVKGLMTIAPFEKNTENLRPLFRKLKETYDRIKNQEKGNISMEFLSMGMTNDYEIAIEEGSNMVRIGSGFFGERKF